MALPRTVVLCRHALDLRYARGVRDLVLESGSVEWPRFQSTALTLFFTLIFASIFDMIVF